MKDSVSSLFPEKGMGLAIFGSFMQDGKAEEEGGGIDAVWSWANVNRDGGGKG